MNTLDRLAKRIGHESKQASWSSCQFAENIEDRRTRGGWGKPTQASMMQRAGPGSWEKIHTSPYLATFSLQCRVGPGDRSTGKDSRDKQGAGGSEDMLIRSLWCDCRNRCVSHCQIQKDCPKTYWTHRHPKTYYWTLCCPSERWDPAPSTGT